jgi:hypothetical protein
LLNAKGRIRLQGNVPEWVAEATKHLREAPLTHDMRDPAADPGYKCQFQILHLFGFRRDS